MMGACMREETSSFPHLFLLILEEKIAKTSLQEKSFCLAGSGLPFSRFIHAVFMIDSFFRCPASKYSRCGCFLSLKTEKQPFWKGQSKCKVQTETWVASESPPLILIFTSYWRQSWRGCNYIIAEYGVIPFCPKTKFRSESVLRSRDIGLSLPCSFGTCLSLGTWPLQLSALNSCSSAIRIEQTQW